MADFALADKLVRTIEGKWIDHSADRGGETYAGISRQAWPLAPVWPFIDEAKTEPGFPGNIKHKALAPLVAAFYLENFWNEIRGDDIGPQLVANHVYDIAVNSGPRQAGRYLQRTLNLLNRQGRDYPDISVDGNIGPKTLEALEAFLKVRGDIGVYTLGFYLFVQMGGLWVRLASDNEEQESFMNGWGKRGLLMAREYAGHYLTEDLK